MNNLQETLLFPVRDAQARKQFLIACLIVLAGYVIPLLPSFVLMGYGAKIMRQIIRERKSPSMPEWQGSNWSEMFLDGLRLYGIQLVYMLPLFLIMIFSMIAFFGGSIAIGIGAEENADALALLGMVLFFAGFAGMTLFALLSLPYGVVIGAAGPHVVARESFAAGFEFREWWEIFRKAFGQFILGYAIVMAMSFVFVFMVQFAVLTLILICVVPFIMIPYTAYLMLVQNTLFAQAYAAGRDALQGE